MQINPFSLLRTRETLHGENRLGTLWERFVSLPWFFLHQLAVVETGRMRQTGDLPICIFQRETFSTNCHLKQMFW